MKRSDENFIRKLVRQVAAESVSGVGGLTVDVVERKLDSLHGGMLGFPKKVGLTPEQAREFDKLGDEFLWLRDNILRLLGQPELIRKETRRNITQVGD